MKTARIFPRKTKATPNDEYAFFDMPGMFLPKIDSVHVSVTFTYDIPKAETLAKQWEHIAPVTIGGPAYNKPSGEFTPGMYLKNGYVITSRGCHNKCWFCSVWQREPEVKELKIHDGFNVLDDNILACSDDHIKKVFSMLTRQKERVQFSGGLEAKILQEWHVNLMCKLKPKPQLYFAYDEPADLEPLILASKILKKTDLMNSNRATCYVLIGYPKDTMEKAEIRLIETIKLGFFPMAMLWKNKKGETTKVWRNFQREWANAVIVGSKVKKIKAGEKNAFEVLKTKHNSSRQPATKQASSR